MPERKNQHYVPQFYFRGWTDNEKVPVFHIENKQEYRPTSISNLCSEDYFYGSTEVEEATDDIEDFHARIIQKLRKTMNFRLLDDDELYNFCIFVLYLKSRTKHTKKEVDYLTDMMAKELIKMNVEAGLADDEILKHIDDFKITDDSIHMRTILHALTGTELILDLEVALLINNTENEFFFSDHPVAFDNQMYKNGQDRFLYGLQSRGLQIYLPLSGNVCVLLYDEMCYSVNYSNHRARRVIVNSEETVQGLNDFQAITAGEFIFYQSSEKENEIIDCLDRVGDERRDEPLNFRTHEEEHEFPTENPVTEAGSQTVDYDINFPFMQKRPNVPHKIQRNPELVESHNEYVDTLLEKYKS
jgi:hypothetical protein